MTVATTKAASAATTRAVATTTKTAGTVTTGTGPQATCTASISTVAPIKNSNETVTVKSNQPNSTISISAEYKTTTLTYTGTTDGAGNGTVLFNIGTAVSGNTVKLTVTVRAATCSTSFTTQ